MQQYAFCIILYQYQTAFPVSDIVVVKSSPVSPVSDSASQQQELWKGNVRMRGADILMFHVPVLVAYITSTVLYVQ